MATLARIVETAINGSLMTWAFYEEGPAERWVLDDVNAVLRPYVRKQSRSGSARHRARSGTLGPR